MKYFISYTHKDESWATWIAEVIEKNGGIALVQVWDTHPGDNFVQKMDEFIKKADVVVPVCSKEYFDSYYCGKEWEAAFAKAKSGNKKMIPVRVADYEPDGILSAEVNIDLHGDSDEKIATNKLLHGLGIKETERTSSGFPGSQQTETKELTSNNIRAGFTNTSRPSILRRIFDVSVPQSYYSETAKKVLGIELNTFCAVHESIHPLISENIHPDNDYALKVISINEMSRAERKGTLIIDDTPPMSNRNVNMHLIGGAISERNTKLLFDYVSPKDKNSYGFLEYRGGLVDFPVVWLCDESHTELINRYDINNSIQKSPNWGIRIPRAGNSYDKMFPLSNPSTGLILYNYL